MLDVAISPELSLDLWNCHEQSCVGLHQPLTSVMRQPTNNGASEQFSSEAGMCLPRESTGIAMTHRKLSTVMSPIMQKKLLYAESATPKAQPSMLLDSRGVAKSGLPARVPDAKHYCWSMGYTRQYGLSQMVGENRDLVG